MPGKTFCAGILAARDPRCFNEAPAKCRGKHLRPLSMLSMKLGFNEAPAKCRGKRLQAQGAA